MGWCPHCEGYHPTHRDYDTGMISCSNCGKVLQHDEFTEEPTFVKGAGGESRLAGSYVKSFQSDYSESFRRTIDKGKQKIHELAVSLGIEDVGATNLADAFYKIAVERSFTKGRRTDQVAAACLYIACRYVLGAVFLQLCQLLSLQEHPIVQKAVDPSLFIGRYTNALVGENRKVNSTALHIIASMKRDWMQVKAVHVCEATLTKRLIEFENTDSGSLTFIELSGGIHGGADPPAFQIAERERLAEVSSEKVTDSSFILKPHRHESSDEHISEVELKHSTKANQNATEAETANFTESACASSVEDQATIGDDADVFQKCNDTNSIADEPDRLSDIDDDEVEGYLNNEQECYYKKIIWEEMNKEYLQEQAAKEAAAAAAFKDRSGASDEMRSAQELAAAANAAVAKLREDLVFLGQLSISKSIAVLGLLRVLVCESGTTAKTSFRKWQSCSNSCRSNSPNANKEGMGLSSKINYDVLDKLFDDQPVHDTKRTRIESPHASDIDVQQQFSKERNGAYTDYDGHEQEEENGDVEEMGGEKPYTDEWYSRNEEEVEDYSYYDNDGDDEY
ncbi:hypothetical protein RHMOL_Rhmol05G0028700 [Rhododendron molle]|uniref:Uncharacterized protein n=1 Tax=Rhododendron molle TaxID=49168 RepID=A0ACC0NKU3_RHOML|nr:hypothetical protein RHMOL_Rhmol05G0028700 [Rhododendron molle]